MGRTCIADHRPEHSIDTSSDWLNGCAQCEIERLRAEVEAWKKAGEQWDADEKRYGELLDLWKARALKSEAEIDRLRAEVEALREQVTTERERCALICEKWRATWEREGTPHPDFIASVIAAEICNA